MKIQNQNSEDLKFIGELIQTASVCMLVITSRDGTLKAKPMSPLEMAHDGGIWFFTSLPLAKLDNLEHVNLSFIDESKANYISISGAGELTTDKVRIKELWTEFARPWFPDGPDSANLALLKVIPHVAEYWDAPNSTIVRSLAMVASIAAHKPIGLGDHAELNDLNKTI